MKKITIIVFAALLAVSCTENARARKFGGTEIIDLPSNRKLEFVTWKGDQLWYSTRQMRKEDIAETHKFHEKSSYGVWEGTIVIKEHK